MKSRRTSKILLAPAFAIALATGSTDAIASANAGVEGPRTFGVDVLGEAQKATPVLLFGRVTDGTAGSGELDGAIEVVRCRARRSVSGRGRRYGGGRPAKAPSIVNVPDPNGTRKSRAESTETNRGGGYYDENGVFHGDSKPARN